MEFDFHITKKMAVKKPYILGSFQSDPSSYSTSVIKSLKEATVKIPVRMNGDVLLYSVVRELVSASRLSLDGLFSYLHDALEKGENMKDAFLQFVKDKGGSVESSDKEKGIKSSNFFADQIARSIGQRTVEAIMSYSTPAQRFNTWKEETHFSDVLSIISSAVRFERALLVSKGELELKDAMKEILATSPFIRFTHSLLQFKIETKSPVADMWALPVLEYLDQEYRDIISEHEEINVVAKNHELFFPTIATALEMIFASVKFHGNVSMDNVKKIEIKEFLNNLRIGSITDQSIYPAILSDPKGLETDPQICALLRIIKKKWYIECLNANDQLTSIRPEYIRQENYSVIRDINYLSCAITVSLEFVRAVVTTLYDELKRIIDVCSGKGNFLGFGYLSVVTLLNSFFGVPDEDIASLLDKYIVRIDKRMNAVDDDMMAKIAPLYTTSARGFTPINKSQTNDWGLLNAQIEGKYSYNPNGDLRWRIFERVGPTLAKYTHAQSLIFDWPKVGYLGSTIPIDSFDHFEPIVSNTIVYRLPLVAEFNRLVNLEDMTFSRAITSKQKVENSGIMLNQRILEYLVKLGIVEMKYVSNIDDFFIMLQMPKNPLIEDIIYMRFPKLRERSIIIGMMKQELADLMILWTRDHESFDDTYYILNIMGRMALAQPSSSTSSYADLSSVMTGHMDEDRATLNPFLIIPDVYALESMAIDWSKDPIIHEGKGNPKKIGMDEDKPGRNSKHHKKQKKAGEKKGNDKETEEKKKLDDEEKKVTTKNLDDIDTNTV